MKRLRIWALLTLAVLLPGTAVWVETWKPEVLEETVTTGTGMVTDRAMSNGLPYLSVELDDGSTVPCWNLYDAALPEEVTPGSGVEITWGKEEAHRRNVVLEIKKR